ncbi:Nodule Cysteine-Rich (NCR) secreted peptide [Medicago truncatula]|uniref:Nodule Cysteine-Rich (NCR) secreted peptide n=2 Tax=Medicago truncatula TaxID=3880 RepID=A0A072UW27_MEDTR|nr:Nodule Cysteine-Rich (NCR) secreted peptide [Medicago truncatula]
MAQTLISVFALILILSPFLVVTDRDPIYCKSDADCPKESYPLFVKCVDNFCDFIIV